MDNEKFDDDEIYFFSSEEEEDFAVSNKRARANSKTLFATSATTIGQDPQLLLGLVMLSYPSGGGCDEVLLYTRDKRIMFRGVIDESFSITISKASASIRASNNPKSYILQLPSDDNCVLFAATVLRSINRYSKQRAYVDVVVGQGDQDVGIGSSILYEICTFDQTASGTLKMSAKTRTERLNISEKFADDVQWQGGFLGMKVRGKRIIASGQMVVLVTVRRLKAAKLKGKNKDTRVNINMGATPVHDVPTISSSMSASQASDGIYDTVDSKPTSPGISRHGSASLLIEDEPLPISAPLPRAPVSALSPSEPLEITLSRLYQEVSNISASLALLCDSLPKDLCNLNRRLDDISKSLGITADQGASGSTGPVPQPPP